MLIVKPSIGHWSMLLFKLTPALSFLSFDALSLLKGQHFLVLHSQLSTLKVKVVEMINHDCSFIGRREISKSQAAENAIIKMIVECVRQRQTHLGHNVDQLLFLDRKGNVFNHNCRRYELLILIRPKGIRAVLQAGQLRRSESAEGVQSWERRYWRSLGIEPSLVDVSVN